MTLNIARTISQETPEIVPALCSVSAQRILRIAAAAGAVPSADLDRCLEFMARLTREDAQKLVGYFEILREQSSAYEQNKVAPKIKELIEAERFLSLFSASAGEQLNQAMRTAEFLVSAVPCYHAGISETLSGSMKRLGFGGWTSVEAALLLGVLDRLKIAEPITGIEVVNALIEGDDICRAEPSTAREP